MSPHFGVSIFSGGQNLKVCMDQERERKDVGAGERKDKEEKRGGGRRRRNGKEEEDEERNEQKREKERGGRGGGGRGKRGQGTEKENCKHRGQCTPGFESPHLLRARTQ